MVTTKQKWLLGGLIAFSTAIWTPQIMERMGGETSSQVSIDSGPTEQEMILAEAVSAGALEPFPVPAPTAPRVRPTSSGAASDGSSAERSVGSSHAMLSEVLRTLRQSDAFHVNSDLAELALEAPVEDSPSEPEPEPELPALVAFVQDHPLRGTIVGETTRMALIGKHRVHFGDLVPGTAARLTDVGRGRATLTEGEIVLELTLEPLETSVELMRARSSAQALSSKAGSQPADPLDSASFLLDAAPHDESAPASNAPAPGTPAPPELPSSIGDF